MWDISCGIFLVGYLLWDISCVISLVGRPYILPVLFPFSLLQNILHHFLPDLIQDVTPLCPDFFRCVTPSGTWPPLRYLPLLPEYLLLPAISCPWIPVHSPACHLPGFRAILLEKVFLAFNFQLADLVSLLSSSYIT